MIRRESIETQPIPGHIDTPGLCMEEHIRILLECERWPDLSPASEGLPHTTQKEPIRSGNRAPLAFVLFMLSYYRAICLIS